MRNAIPRQTRSYGDHCIVSSDKPVELFRSFVTLILSLGWNKHEIIESTIFDSL